MIIPHVRALSENNQKNVDISISVAKRLQLDYIFFYLLDTPETNEILSKEIEQDIILIGTVDVFNNKNGIETPYKQNVLMPQEQVIYEIAFKYPNKTFIIFNQYMDTKPLYINELLDNVYFVHWSYIMYAYDEYKQINIPNKNNNSRKIGIAFNRQMREHRTVLVSYLYGLNMQHNMYISAIIMNNSNCDIMLETGWDFANFDNFKQTIVNGYKQIPHNEVEDFYYDKNGNFSIDNVFNFNNNKYSLYQDSFVEIITETLYHVPMGIITEKYLHSVYGRNFPILISAVNTVQHLRDIGFDVFDDVVDHSYDTVVDPIARMEMAIQKNKHLIEDYNTTIQLWNKLQYRFDDNINYIQSGAMKTYFSTLIELQITNIINNI